MGVQTQIHNLDVYVSPIITDPREGVIAVEHDDVTLRCSVYGHPTPEIRWGLFNFKLKDATGIEPSDIFVH